jgi:uncharacterized membrane protein YuzA (DUF378 family)
MKTNGLDWLAIILVVIGAITWGILGVTGLTGNPLNVVSLFLEPIFRPGPAQTVEYLVYLLVGISGVYLLYTAYKMGRASRRATRERRRRDATRAETTDYADTDRENTESLSFFSRVLIFGRLLTWSRTWCEVLLT